ncbi:MAG: UDP-N-acetylmuramate dehydrogenase [Coriobacteriia bacterium]|nr:UDP-N-acetylmuramate dehydrogenase [Coriobacteriia bacterium]
MAARHTSELQALLVDDKFDGEVLPNEPLSRHTTYHIGGPARFLVQADSIGALTKLVGACESEDVPWVIVGRGSNLLVADEGYPGVVITLGRDFRNSYFDEERCQYVAGAGVSLTAVVQDAFQRTLAGLEFAVGTPGSMGGALRMNAGTRTDWIGSAVRSVTVFSSSQGLRKLSGSQVQWGYRSTSFAPDDVILECELAVEPADPVYIRGKMEASLARRRRTQPLSMPSCGSVFKSPEGMSAGSLIEGVGLKGARVGGAQISEVHANFIVNLGGATAQDVCALMEQAKAKVYEAHGIELKPEVRFLGIS